MNIVMALLLALAAELPQVEVATLQGESHAGTLAALSDAGATVATPDGERLVPLSSLMELRLAGAATDPAQPGPLEVRLVDGTRLRCSEVTVDRSAAALVHPQLGALAVPLAALQSIRFGATGPEVEPAWDAYVAREEARDLLVVRKENVLDHLSGVVGTIDAERIDFLLDGDVIPVKRERAFGVVYNRRRAAPARPLCELRLSGGDTIRLRQVSWDGTAWRATLLAGSEVEVPAAAVASIDFSLGKVRYLSQLEPREVKHTPYWDITWEYRRDRHLDGGPLRLGGQSYRRGLSLHSRTLLRYRLGGEYTRFQATMGIDDVVRPLGNLRLTIRGDERSLFDATVRGTDPPQVLDLDVTGVRDLEILVDFGEDLDIADHLDLADAKVIQ